MELFRLKAGDPILMGRDELEDLGFTPHGDAYIVFPIEESIGLEKLSFNDGFIEKVKKSTVPFIEHFN